MTCARHLLAALTALTALTGLTLTATEPAAAAAILPPLCHALLERRAFLGRHRRHPFLEPLAALFALFGSHAARVEPAAAAAEPAPSATLAIACARRRTIGRLVSAAPILGR